MWKNDQNSYGTISKTIHWVMALLILTLIGVGLFMTGLDKAEPDRLKIYGMHKSFGVLVMWLAVLRLIWIGYSRPPALPEVLRKWEKGLSKAVTSLLYVLMLAVQFSGYVMTQAAGFPVRFFGLLDMPVMFEKSKALAGFAHTSHTVLVYALIALLLMHLAGALKHRFIDGEEADVLHRMLWTSESGYGVYDKASQAKPSLGSHDNAVSA